MSTLSRSLRIILAGTFLILAAGVLIGFKLTQPRILVLHSYDVGYEWTRDINVTLRRNLDPMLRYQVHWHYMDTKNHPWPDFKRNAAAIANRAIESIKPDVIIAVDDDAHEYVVQELANHPRIAIVFAGINGEIEPYGYDKAKNVTGVFERKPLADLREALKVMRAHDKPLGKRILHIGDRSGSVLVDTVEIEGLEWKPFTIVRSALVDSFEEWQAAVKGAAAEADLILVSNYRTLYQNSTRNKVVPPEQIVRWTEANSKVPVVGIGGYFVEDGGMFALGTSGFEQGDIAGKMTIRILERKETPADIPKVLPKQFISYMRPRLLEKRGITLPPLYESFARATNNYFDQP